MPKLPRKQKKNAARQATEPAAGLPRRSNLHEVLAGRKTARHRPDSEKRVAQKLRRELEND